ncbi:hypothetical protein HanIR_Chr04g0171531 [Helianthus annuus]|nr:hypothetical protein HanIR_Chr04g0171531 [Helianthus annuus]
MKRPKLVKSACFLLLLWVQPGAFLWGTHNNFPQPLLAKLLGPCYTAEVFSKDFNKRDALQCYFRCSTVCTLKYENSLRDTSIRDRLTDSESIANLPDEAYYKDPMLKPYIFYDITHGRSHIGAGQFRIRISTKPSFALGYINIFKKVSSL